MSLTIIEQEKITSKIYEIRGQKVMLDRDLAELYQVETFNLNKAVKRNNARFPESFMFQLTKDEFNLIFQKGMSNWGGVRRPPYAFTEYGVLQLSNILRSDIAIDISQKIIKIFVELRNQIASGTAIPILKEKILRIEAEQLAMTSMVDSVELNQKIDNKLLMNGISLFTELIN